MRKTFKDENYQKFKPGAPERVQKETELRQKLNDVLSMIPAKHFFDQTWLMTAIIDSWWWTLKKNSCEKVFADSWQKEKYGKYYVKTRKAGRDYEKKGAN